MGDQIGAMLRRQPKALVTPPALDLRMVARHQRGRHGFATPLFWPGVMGAIEQAVQRRVEAVLRVAGVVAQHTRLQARHGVEQGHGGDFTTRQHKITQADLFGDEFINEALVHPFIPPTDQNRAGTAGPALHGGVFQRIADWREQHHGRWVRPLCANGGNGLRQRFGWNALMIQGLCAAYQATGQLLYLQSARRAADFLMERMTMPDGGLYRALSTPE